MKPQKIRIEDKDYYHFPSEFQRLKYLYSNIVTAVLIVVLLGMGIGLSYVIITHSERIMSNPFTYGANRMDGDIYCSCTQIYNSGTYKFEFNKSTWWSEPTNPYANLGKEYADFSMNITSED